MSLDIATNIIAFNRQTLSSVPNWIQMKDWQSPPSIYNYGLPERVLPLINLPLSNDYTEADLLCQFALELKEVSYLEIGVSVGKTFYQIVEYCRSHLQNFRFSCLDIEEPNPVLAALLARSFPGVNVTEFPSCSSSEILGGALARGAPNKVFSWGQDKVKYYVGNEYDPTIWRKIDSKFNLIFSDAYHQPDALLVEYDQLRVNNLIDYEKVIYCFDDLDNATDEGMWKSVHYIYEDIKKHKPSAQLFHCVVNGWLGQHEHAHNFGLIR